MKKKQDLTLPQKVAVFAAKRKVADEIRYRTNDHEGIAYRLHEIAKLCEMREQSDYEDTILDSDSLDNVIAEKLDKVRYELNEIKIRDEIASAIFRESYETTEEKVRDLGFKMKL